VDKHLAHRDIIILLAWFMLRTVSGITAPASSNHHCCHIDAGSALSQTFDDCQSLPDHWSAQHENLWDGEVPGP